VSITPSPSPVESLKPPPPVVTRKFAAQKSAKGVHYALVVDDVSRPYGCRLHSFSTEGKGRGAFLTDRPFLRNQGYEVLLFYVLPRNTNGRAATYDLRDFDGKPTLTITFEGEHTIG
jgi:hypothetical protein